MAVDYGIRLELDADQIGTAEVSRILSRVLRVLDSDAPIIGFAASYTDASRVYNVVIQVGTIVAADIGYEILVDAGKSDDFKSEVLRRVLQVLADQTTVLHELNTSYSAGSGESNQITLTIS